MGTTTMGDAASLLVSSSKENYIDLPPGFRFHPSDEEIVTHYLYERVKDAGFSAIAIGEADLNKSEPWELPKLATMGEKEWYFFCERDKKYPTGMRTNRATRSGYWKATGKDKEIYKGKGCLVGMKKTLVFYMGRAPKGQKTNWVMHEYRMEGKTSYWKLPRAAKDEWVVCRVFHKSIGLKKKPETGHGATVCSMNPSADYRDDDMSSALPPLEESPYLMTNNTHNHHSRSGFIEGGTHFRGTQPTGATPCMAPYMSTTVEQYQPPDIHNGLPPNYFNGTTTMASNNIPASLSHQNPTPNVPNTSYYHPPHGEDYFKGYGAAAHHVDVNASSPLRRHCKVEQLQFSNHSGISAASPETSGVHGNNHELYNDMADWQISSRTTLAELDNLLNKYS